MMIQLLGISQARPIMKTIQFSLRTDYRGDYLSPDESVTNLIKEIVAAINDREFELVAVYVDGNKILEPS